MPHENYEKPFNLQHLASPIPPALQEVTEIQRNFLVNPLITQDKRKKLMDFP